VNAINNKQRRAFPSEPGAATIVIGADNSYRPSVNAVPFMPITS